MSLELVRWRDAFFEVTEEDKPEDYDFILEVVGWVTEQRRFLKVVSEHGEGQSRAVTYIPNCCVVQRIKLKKT